MAADKHQKFIDLAEKRVNRALRDLRLIGNLANRKNYEYTDEQVRKIMRTLKQAVSEVERRFTEEDAERDHFRLK